MLELVYAAVAAVVASVVVAIITNKVTISKLKTMRSLRLGTQRAEREKLSTMRLKPQKLQKRNLCWK